MNKFRFTGKVPMTIDFNSMPYTVLPNHEYPYEVASKFLRFFEEVVEHNDITPQVLEEVELTLNLKPKTLTFNKDDDGVKEVGIETNATALNVVFNQDELNVVNTGATLEVQPLKSKKGNFIVIVEAQHGGKKLERSLKVVVK